MTDTSAVPPEDAPSAAEFVSITGVGDHGPPAATTPAGTTELPLLTLTETDPTPAMKKRIAGSVASTQVGGDCADDPAGSDSENEPRVPVTA